MGPRELLAAVEILSAEGRVPRKVEFKEGPGFKQIRHLGDNSGIMYITRNGKRYIILHWNLSYSYTYPSLPRFLLRSQNTIITSNGKVLHIQLTYKEAQKILA